MGHLQPGRLFTQQHSPNFSYSEGKGSMAKAILLLTVIGRKNTHRGKLKRTVRASFKLPMTVHFACRHMISLPLYFPSTRTQLLGLPLRTCQYICYQIMIANAPWTSWLVKPTSRKVCWLVRPEQLPGEQDQQIRQNCKSHTTICTLLRLLEGTAHYADELLVFF